MQYYAPEIYVSTTFFFYQKGILCKFKHKWTFKDRLNWNSIDFLPEYGAPSLFTRKTPVW